MSPRIALITCRTWPALSKSDLLYASALQDLGAIVEAVPWNGTQDYRLSEYDAAVLRSNWDYHDNVPEFKSWLRSVDDSDAVLLNPCKDVLYFLDKRSLLELQANGVPMGKVRAVDCDADAVRSVLAEESWEKAVLKPVYGASGRGVELVQKEDAEAAVDRLKRDVGPRDLLVQEFLPEIQSGEIQMVFFNGNFSHAVRKIPAAGEFRTNSKHDPVVENYYPDDTSIQSARTILLSLDSVPLYARVDGVLRDGQFILNELEVNEPGLWLDRAGPDAAAWFAQATLQRILAA